MYVHIFLHLSSIHSYNKGIDLSANYWLHVNGLFIIQISIGKQLLQIYIYERMVRISAEFSYNIK